MRERARNLKNALEELGPTFAKLGQILSTRPDLLPPEFIDELATLQDKVTPMNEEDVVSVMEEELGVPWEDVFESIEPEPLAAGTIGQVHVATLESGQKVVVKVQRRGARVAIMRDLGLLELFASKAENRPGLRKLVDIPAVIRHLSDSLYRELDFRREAANIGRLREVLRPYSQLAVPGRDPADLDLAAARPRLHRRRQRPRRARRAGAPLGCPAADRVVLPADPRRRLLPCRSASRQPALVGRRTSTSSTAGWSASSTPSCASR